MIAIENVNTYVTGVQPNAVADNSTGAATADGFEFIAEFINNSIIGPQQDWLDYAGLTPNGVTEAAGASQSREAVQLGLAAIPGRVFRRDTFQDPSVFGDRSILLAEQGILHAAYPELLAACYVGDATNNAVAAAGGYYYKSTDAAGLTPNIAGTYLQLPPNPVPTGLRQYSEAAGDFTVTGANWTTTRAVAVPYQTINGVWRLIFNIGGTLSVSATSIILTVLGVTFKNSIAQSSSGSHGYGSSLSGESAVNTNTSLLRFTGSSVSTIFTQSGDVELDGIPDMAKVFDIKHAITY